MYLGTNVNINENPALHAYLFILLYVKKRKYQKYSVATPRKRGLSS
jgi:hypothetical protein